MIQIGLSDSPTARALLTGGEINIDYLEAHGPYVESARAQFPAFPLVLHNSLYHWSLSHPDALNERSAAALTLQRLELARSPWYSIHLGFSAVEVNFADEAIQALTPPLPADLILERTCRSIRQLQALLPVPLLLENMDYNPTGAYETICDTRFICTVLQETGTDLLLDLAHARVTAAAQGMAVEAYLEQLPFERVRQIHINRPGWRDGRRVDSHEAMQTEDYALLETVLQRCRPWAITLEYNQDAARMKEQIQHLRVCAARANHNRPPTP